MSIRQHRVSPLSREEFHWDGVTEGEIVLYLIIEEVFREVKGQGEYREQKPPNFNCRVAKSIWVAVRKLGGTEFNLLVLQDSLSEGGQLIGPHICTSHRPVVGFVGASGSWIQFLPTNFIALVHIAHVFWIIVAA